MIDGIRRGAGHAAVATAGLFLVLCCGPGFAESAVPTLDPAVRAEVVGSIADLVREHYVFPEVAESVAAELRSKLAAGAYDECQTPRHLAAVIWDQLETYDRHFHVGWSPAGSAEPVMSHSAEELDAWRTWSKLQNYGFKRVEVLPGNVGYLDLRYFDDTALAGDTATAAMGLLANTDAVIVDVRNNGGGEPAMVQYLISHFFEPEPVLYNSFSMRAGGQIRQLWTLAWLPGRRMPSVPLYVLTSPRTGSAAEAFAYSLQALGRAAIIGQRTAGAANPGEPFDAGHGFSVFISTGAPVNPVTGTNWEGTGVQPDVEVDSEAALDTARIAALEQLLDGAEGPIDRRVVSWALDALRLEQEPRTLSRAQMADYVGEYGDRQIRLEGQELTYQRGRRSRRVLMPLEHDVFVLTGVDGYRMHFERDETGAVVRLIGLWSDGHQETNLRR